jgi:hypothetical protein
MIEDRPERGTAVPRAVESTAEEDRIAEALLRELHTDDRLPGNIVMGMVPAVEVVQALLAAGVIAPGRAPSLPLPKALTPRECAQHAAAALAEATTLARTGIAGDGPDRARALVLVADGYRTLGATINGAVNMQPEQEGNN